MTELIGIIGKCVKERAQWLLAHPVLTELELPVQSSGEHVRRLMSKLEMEK